jgi:MFS family permease
MRPLATTVDPMHTNDRHSLEVPLLSQPQPQQQQQQHDDEEERTAAYSPLRNRNIRVTLIYTLLSFAGRSLWSQSVLSTFVYLLQNNDAKAVGFITAAMGLSQFLSSFPAGILADRYRRDRILKLASFVGLVAIGLTYIAVLAKRSYIWLTVALSVWGVFWGIAGTSTGALFADSIKHGERSEYFTKRAILVRVGNMVGPASALILFAVLGDEWTIQDCAIVMAVGNGLCVPAVLLLCFLSDDLGEDKEDEAASGGATGSLSTDETVLLVDRERREQEEATRFCCRLPKHRITPILVCIGG